MNQIKSTQRLSFKLYNSGQLWKLKAVQRETVLNEESSNIKDTIVAERTFHAPKAKS